MAASFLKAEIQERIVHRVDEHNRGNHQQAHVRHHRHRAGDGRPRRRLGDKFLDGGQNRHRQERGAENQE